MQCHADAQMKTKKCTFDEWIVKITRPPVQHHRQKRMIWPENYNYFLSFLWDERGNANCCAVLLVTERFAQEMRIGLLTILLCATAHRFIRSLCFTLFLLFRPWPSGLRWLIFTFFSCPVSRFSLGYTAHLFLLIQILFVSMDVNACVHGISWLHLYENHDVQSK